MTAATTEPNVQGVKVGDFFVCSWGYDQTNVDFYKVVALTAKSIKVQQWKSRRVSSGTWQCNVVPGNGPATYTDWSQDPKVEREVKVQLKRVRIWSGRPTFYVNSFSDAYAWDGTPQYETAPGAGR